MLDASALRLLVAASLVLGTTAFLRLLHIVTSLSRSYNDCSKLPESAIAHVVIVLGSGGHTAEMMSIVRDINPRRYIHRTYIVSSGDDFSSEKAFEIERRLQSTCTAEPGLPTAAGEYNEITGIWDIEVVPRARKIHQPLYTAPLSSLWCLIGCLKALQAASRRSQATPHEYPGVIITNGPATAVIVILAAFVLKYFGIAPLSKMKNIYIESWARVTTLSLSGKILLQLGVCDKFLVQWEALAKAINGNGAKKKVAWEGFLVE